MRETDGGNYFAEYAENNFTHLREVPHVEICNGHDEFVHAPGFDYASAIVVAVVVLVCLACAAAAIWHGA